MMPKTPQERVDYIFHSALVLAENLRHRYLLLDHLMWALAEDKAIAAILRHFKIDAEKLAHIIFTNLRDSVDFEKSAEPPVVTKAVQRVGESANSRAQLAGRNFLTVMDIFYSLLDETQTTPYTVLVQSGCDMPALKSTLLSFINEFNKSAHVIEEYPGMIEKAMQSIESGTSRIVFKRAEPVNMSNGAHETGQTGKDDDPLEQYCVNLNALAEQGKLAPVIGREAETEKVLQALGRKLKSNLIIVGDSGTGKTAIVDGLVNRIVFKQVPASLANSIVYSLDIGALLAGTKFRGDFEERFKGVVNRLKEIPNSILFIDEIHMIRGAGAGSESSMDAANLLKPSLARGEIRVIGATTHEEYRKFFEKDKALMRRFYKLDISEPSVEDTKEILRKSIGTFEEFHKVQYDPESLDTLVDLAHKHIHDRRFPDKAFDIVDAVGSRKKLFSTPDDRRITIDDIEQEISQMAKVSLVKKNENSLDSLSSLSDRLKETVFGQNEAIDMLVNYVLISKAGLREGDKTQLAALLRGPTGCGKTEVAKQLAKELGISFVRFDMSEYQEKHAISKLIGSPPGYVGHGEGSVGDGQLINEVEKHPHCVLLLDEVEKAHPDVLNILLQVMDYGMLTSSSGKTISFRNVILLLTSNLGAKDSEKNNIGFGRDFKDNDKQDEATKSFFAPEFRNRLDFIVSFNKLSTSTMMSVVDKFVGSINELMKDRNISVELTTEAKEYVVDQANKENMGARPIMSILTKKIKEQLSKEILFGNLKNGGHVIAEIVDNDIKLNYNVSESTNSESEEVNVIK